MRRDCSGKGICRRAGKYLETIKCYCVDGFHGENCEKQYTACEFASIQGAPCQNGGVCENLEHRLKYTCICPDEWIGEHCEMTAHSPVSLPFLGLTILL